MPSTIVNRASTPKSYLIDTQGKWYCRSRECIHLLQQDIFKVTTSQPQGNKKPTHFPRPHPISKHRGLPQPSKCSPSHSKSTKSNIHIPHLQWPSWPNHTSLPGTHTAMINDLLHDLAPLNDQSMNNLSQCVSPHPWHSPLHLCWKHQLNQQLKLFKPQWLYHIEPIHPIQPNQWQFWQLWLWLQASKAAVRSEWQLWPRLPITYNETALRCLNGRPQVWTLNSLSLPLPNNP